MGERWDRLRSAVERARASVRERARDGTLAKVRRAVRELGEQKARVSMTHLRRLIMHVPGVEAGSIARAESGALAIDLELEGKKRVRAELLFLASQFAPRGPKELSFKVSPPEAAGEPVMRELVGALGALVARTLWSASLPPAKGPHESGLVDRDGDVLRIDLRTLGAVRDAIARGPSVALLLDLITPAAIDVDHDGLVVRIALPALRA